MVTATSACLRSQVGMYLCSYVEAVKFIGEASQDVDPEDGDFQVPWLSFAGPFSVPLGFVCFFQEIYFFVARFRVPVLGPKNGLKNEPRIQSLIGLLL